jgi:hypothetical protein
MPYRRRILRYGTDPADLLGTLSDDAVAGCWFELLRQGGCGAGEIQLRTAFADRHVVEVGEWIAFEFDDGERWYLGRVESRTADSSAGVTLQLEGMAVELGEVFPGGFGLTADGRKPHRYGVTDGFAGDPDYSQESVDIVTRPEDLVRQMLSQYVTGATHITVDPPRIEDQAQSVVLESAKFHGEESVRSILKEVGLRAGNVPWGVDETGKFYFLQPRTAVVATWREGRDPVRLRETADRGLLYNRVLLTGGYIYDQLISSGIRKNFRWRGNYIQPASKAAYGERRIRLWTPWIRTAADSRAFVQAFFSVYAAPSVSYELEVPDRDTLIRPWEGVVRLEDRLGTELLTAAVTTLRIQFDHRPRFRLHLGLEDPHTHWPEPPHDERWPEGSTAVSGWGGGDVSQPGGGGGGGGGGSTSAGDVDSSSPLVSSGLTSSQWNSSGLPSSGGSSVLSSGLSSGETATGTASTGGTGTSAADSGTGTGSGSTAGGTSGQSSGPADSGSSPTGSSAGGSSAGMSSGGTSQPSSGTTASDGTGGTTLSGTGGDTQTLISSAATFPSGFSSGSSFNSASGASGNASLP